GGGLRGEQVVGDEHHIVGQVMQALFFFADEAVENSPLDVVDVFDALGEIAVGDGLESGRLFSHHGGHGIFSGDLLLLDHSHHGIDQRLIAQNTDVKVENVADVLAVLLLHAAAQPLELCDGVFDRLFESCDLAGDLVFLDMAPGDGQIFGVQHDGRADHHTWRNRYALFDF